MDWVRHTYTLGRSDIFNLHFIYYDFFFVHIRKFLIFVLSFSLDFSVLIDFVFVWCCQFKRAFLDGVSFLPDCLTIRSPLVIQTWAVRYWGISSRVVLLLGWQHNT
jgi:hypothetical protein